MRRRGRRRVERWDDSWSHFPPKSTPLPADGIKARSARGQKFVESWWADKWIAALVRLVDPNRLQRGRRYARSGQVLSIDFQGAEVKARVQGSRPKPYEVSIRIAALSDKQWEDVISIMASQAIFAAKLLAGEMPPDIESAFSSAALSLFPNDAKDLGTNCSCPDWANPCKHVSAVHYLLGERFDQDPFLLFLLRGKTKEQVVEELRSKRGEVSETSIGDENSPSFDQARETEVEDAAPPLSECIDTFWILGELPAGQGSGSKTASVDAAPVKQLGEPAFWHGGDFLTLMTRAYRDIAECARTQMLGIERPDRPRKTRTKAR